ncbi:MAG: 50S ribosomal protein L25/general stress protein Ctc [Alphaproteobacteria bacterium]
MSGSTTIQAEPRTHLGTGGARATRREARVPGIIYGNEQDPLPVSFDARDIVREISDPAFHTKMYKIEVGGEMHRALARELQLHPVKDHPTHVDFMRVSRSSRVNVFIPIEFINDDKSPGIKRGGVLNMVLHEIEMNCPATEIPDTLTVDLDGLEIGDTVHLNDLTLPKDAKLVHEDRDYTLATVVAPSSVKSEASAESADAADGEGDAEAAAEGDSESAGE